MTNEGELATSRAQGIGKLAKAGRARWLGSFLYYIPSRKIGFSDDFTTLLEGFKSPYSRDSDKPLFLIE